MKKTMKLTAALVAVLLGVQSFAQSGIRFSDRKTDCRQWVAEHFAKGKTPPFSFEYDGRPSSEFLRKWKFSSTVLTPERENENLVAYSWTDPVSKLRLTCQVKTFDDFNAVEWVLYFKNLSTADSPRISSVKVFDIAACSQEEKGDWELF